MKQPDAEKKFGERGDRTRSIRKSISATPRVLTRAEAGKCLDTLGKCDTGYGYAYLTLNASNRNLTDVSAIASFKHVLYVNVSGNRLTSEALRAFETMTCLLTLQADRNCIASAELKPMPYLQVLTLNGNELTDTSGVRHKLLERLELNRNDIRSVTLDPQILENLKTLELRGNALISTEGIRCPSLLQLFLAENQIEKLAGLEALVNLRTLHLRSNNLANLDGFHELCRKLDYVNLRGNRLSETSELKKLRRLPRLKTLIILDNPVTTEGETEEEEVAYRQIVLAILPKLERIDKDPVSDWERNEAREIHGEMIKDRSSLEDFDFNGQN